MPSGADQLAKPGHCLDAGVRGCDRRRETRRREGLSEEYCKIAVVTDEWMYEQDTEYDRILGQTTGLLAQRGDEQAVALLVDVRSIVLIDTDEVIRTERFFDPLA